MVLNDDAVTVLLAVPVQLGREDYNQSVESNSGM
jgi:hypothetical protein